MTRNRRRDEYDDDDQPPRRRRAAGTGSRLPSSYLIGALAGVVVLQLFVCSGCLMLGLIGGAMAPKPDAATEPIAPVAAGDEPVVALPPVDTPRNSSAPQATKPSRTGHYENRVVSCEWCRGKGKVVSDEPFYRQTPTKYMTCKKCRGSGVQNKEVYVP